MLFFVRNYFFFHYKIREETFFKINHERFIIMFNSWFFFILMVISCVFIKLKTQFWYSGYCTPGYIRSVNCIFISLISTFRSVNCLFIFLIDIDNFSVNKLYIYIIQFWTPWLYIHYRDPLIQTTMLIGPSLYIQYRDPNASLDPGYNVFGHLLYTQYRAPNAPLM